MQQHGIQERELIADSYKLAVQIYQSGFKPDLLWGFGAVAARLPLMCKSGFGYSHSAYSCAHQL